jgi:hypothetical protein
MAGIALLVATVPVAAQDEEQPGWFGGSHDDTAMLAYGIRDSDYVMLHFSCTVGRPAVRVYVQDEESSAEAGDLLLVHLSAGEERIEFADEAIPNEDSGGKDVEGQLPLDDVLRRILTGEGTLEITVDGHIQHYMAGAAEPAAAMLAACDAPRPAGPIARD